MSCKAPGVSKYFLKDISLSICITRVVPCRIGDVSTASCYYQSAVFHHQSGGHKVWLGLICPLKNKVGIPWSHATHVDLDQIQKAVTIIPAIAVIIPRTCSFVTLSFKNIIASVMVTMDKAEAMGVINMASPMVNP